MKLKIPTEGSFPIPTQSDDSLHLHEPRLIAVVEGTVHLYHLLYVALLYFLPAATLHDGSWNAAVQLITAKSCCHVCQPLLHYRDRYLILISAII